MRPEQLRTWFGAGMFALAIVLLAPLGAAQDDDGQVSIDDSTLGNDGASYSVHADPVLREDVRRNLEDRRYRFCQDPKYRLFQAEKDALCPNVEAYSNRCPHLAAACQRPSWEADIEESSDSSFDWSWLDMDLSWLGVLFKILFWTALGIGVLLLLRALLKQAKHWREESGVELQGAPLATREHETDVADELRSHVLFALARQKLDEGQVTDGLHFTYRAMIRTLSDVDWVKPHKSKTSGDYLRALRSKKTPGFVRLEGIEGDAPGHAHKPEPSGTELADVTAHLLDLDRERFRGRPRLDRADSLWLHAKGLAARLSHAGVMLLSMWFMACEPDASLPESPYEPFAPRGTQLFEDLLSARAPSLNRRLHRVVDVPAETVSVVSIGAELRPIEWETLNRWVSGGGHLVVAEPNSTFMDEFGATFDTSACSSPLLAPDLTLTQWSEKRAFTEEPVGEILAKCGQRTYATTIRWDQGWLTVIADTTLFQNGNLAAADNATLAFHLVGNVEGHVEFLGPWTGRGSQNPIQSIARAGFGWWVLHVLLLGLLFAWSAGKRMVPPIDPREAPRRAFSEHARALSRRYEKARASGWALQHYAEWVFDTLRKRAPSTRPDMKSITRAVSTSDKEANRLREALTTARRAHELGDSTKEHMATFRRLESALLGTGEVSRKRRKARD